MDPPRDSGEQERKVLVTGAAGFVGFHLCRRLFSQGWTVIGWDTEKVNYPTTTIRKDRLEQLLRDAPPTFLYKDVNIEVMEDVRAAWDPAITKVCHLAARAGVRESLTNPAPYIYTNILGHFNVMEMSKEHGVDHFLYASSSSVYGNDSKVPFKESESCNTPVSLYAATKKADELMTYSYSHLFRLPATGLRFFTVYGPWGRPDMAVYDFTRKIDNGISLPVFNYGKNKRAYTYIDDIVGGIYAAMISPPKPPKIDGDARITRSGQRISDGEPNSNPSKSPTEIRENQKGGNEFGVIPEIIINNCSAEFGEGDRNGNLPKTCPDLPTHEGNGRSKDVDGMKCRTDSTNESSVVSSMDQNGNPNVSWVPHRVFNIGTREMVTTERMIQLLEKNLGKSADRKLVEPLSCDMYETSADFSRLEAETCYAPKIPIEEGIEKFVAWYKSFHNNH